MDGKKCSHPSSFFKINLAVSLEDGGAFVFPNKFNKEHGERLSNRVRLEVPTGTESKMMLKRCDDGQVSLHEGWRDFVDKYTIKYLYLLVFTYKGGSRFQVRIFDSSGLEIEYPRTSCINPRSNMAMYPSFFKTVLGYALEEGTLELPISFVKKHGKSLSTSAYLNVPTGAKSKVELKMNNGRAWLHHGWKDFADKYSIKCGYFLVFLYEAPSQFDVQIYDLTCLEIEYPRPSRKRKTEKEMEMTNQSKNKSQLGNEQVQRAKALQSSNLVFTVTMKPSYANYLPIPSGPASDLFLEKGNDRHKINLNLNGSVWSMNCYFTGTPSHPQVRFSIGWPKFRRKNNLQKGDVCSFELVNSSTMDFKVTISRKNDEEQRLGKRRTRGRPIRVGSTARIRVLEKDEEQQLSKRRTRGRPARMDSTAWIRVLKRSESFKSDNPHFTITMGPYYISDKAGISVQIPADYSRKYMEEDEHGEQVMVLVHGSSGKTWPLWYFFSTNARAFLYRGWKDFTIDNRLKVGDTCIFERIDGKAKKYRVHIFREADQV